MRWRRRVHEVLSSTDANDPTTRRVNGVLVTLILANIAAFIAGSHQDIEARFGTVLVAFETFSVVIFTAEYFLRLWSCVEADGGLPPWRGRFRSLFRPLMIVDLLAILPFYLPVITADLRPLRMVRVLRLFRVLKLGRYSSALQLLRSVVVTCRYELIATLSVVLLAEVLAACLMWLAEKEAQPAAFSSVSASAWWAITTLTTVGYGDITPVTLAGKLIAAASALIGVLVIALPAGILGSAMVEAFRARRPAVPCARCGAIPGDAGCSASAERRPDVR